MLSSTQDVHGTRESHGTDVVLSYFFLNDSSQINSETFKKVIPSNTRSSHQKWAKKSRSLNSMSHIHSQTRRHIAPNTLTKQS